jgi:hypothetical protein
MGMNAKVALAFSANERAHVRTIILLGVFFLTGVALTALWFNQRHREHQQPKQEAADTPLSESTLAVLQNLHGEVEIRFYSLLDPASVPEATRAFSQRVDQLLSAYERAANGKVKAMRYTSRSDANAASSDGIKAFNLDKGDACFLGLSVASGERRESLPQLSPEWEQALESDLSRAIARASSAPPPASVSAASTPPIQPSTIEDVKRALPNLESVPLEQAKGILRDAALAQFRETVQAMSSETLGAQQRLEQARKGNSEAEQQKALQQLQQTQSEQTRKLQEISDKLQAQIAALEQLKGSQK